MKTLTNEAIQAFPVERETYVGTLTNYPAENKEIIHVVEDGSITFDFGDHDITLDVVAGLDLALGHGIVEITSTGTVWIS